MKANAALRSCRVYVYIRLLWAMRMATAVPGGAIAKAAFEFRANEST